MNIILIFTRDFRVEDNQALYAAVNLAKKSGKKITPIFYVDQRQVDPKKNRYFSQYCFDYMINCIHELAKRVPIQVVHKYPPGVAFISQDYSPFAKIRERELAKIYPELHIIPNHALFSWKKEYKVYGPFSRAYKPLNPAKMTIPASIWTNSGAHFGPFRVLPEIEEPCSDSEILARLKKIKHYGRDRNFPALDQTSHLSAALKFGRISPRICYKLVRDPDFRGQLVWRDFFMQLLYYNGFQELKRYGGPKILPDRKVFNKWAQAKTDNEFVNAGMRQLLETGWMHNRMRLIVSNYLIQYMRQPYQWGEQFFATHLVDYDVANNHYNWMLQAGVGTDFRYKFRYYNVDRQQKKYDPDGEFIKMFPNTL